jgi:hypothetical protein
MTFISYKQIEDWFAKARKPDQGRPLSSWCRVYKKDSKFIFYGHGIEFAAVSQDNVLTFTASLPEIKRVCNTLSQALHSVFGLHFNRMSTNKYKIVHPKDVRYGLGIKNWPEYFSGIQFDLKTGKCLNFRPDLSTLVQPDERKLWLRKLRKFKHNIKLRCKIGVMQAIFDRVTKDFANNTVYKSPYWESKEWTNKLYEAINNEDLPMEIMEGIMQTVYTHKTSWGYAPSYLTEYVIEITNKILSDCSIELRIRFGVFEGVTAHETNNA